MGMTPALYDAIITQGEHEAAIDAFNRTKDRLDRERAAKLTGDGAAAPSSGKKKAGATTSKSSSRAPSPSMQVPESVAVPSAAPGVVRDQAASSSWPPASSTAQPPAEALNSSMLGQQPLASGSGGWGTPHVASAYAGHPGGFAPPALSQPPPTFIMPTTHFPQPQASFSAGHPPPTFYPTVPPHSTAPLPPPPPAPALDVWSTSSALAYLSSFSADQPWPALNPGAPSPASLTWAQQALDTFDDPFASPAGAGLEQDPHPPALPVQPFWP